MIPIEIDKPLQGALKIGVLLFEGLNCQKQNSDLWQEIEKLTDEYRQRFSEPTNALDLLKPARDLYRKIGIEPTRTRPSSEALLRRAIKDKPLYQINSIVDAGNLCSLQYLLPVGLYDLSKISGAIILRKGNSGEQFKGIRKDMIHVEGRYTLADEIGPFGNPSSDSLRTSINLNTGNLLFIIYAPSYYLDEKLHLHADFTEQKMLTYHKGKLLSISVIGI